MPTTYCNRRKPENLRRPLACTQIKKNDWRECPDRSMENAHIVCSRWRAWAAEPDRITNTAAHCLWTMFDCLNCQRQSRKPEKRFWPLFNKCPQTNKMLDIEKRANSWQSKGKLIIILLDIFVMQQKTSIEQSMNSESMQTKSKSCWTMSYKSWCGDHKNLQFLNRNTPR